MMRIYLIRHATAEATGAQWEGKDDERPLTRKGVRRFRKAVKGLRKLGLSPSLVLTSPLVRARHTANWLLAGLRSRDIVLKETDHLRPESAARLPSELLDLPRESEVILIGHNPQLVRLASFLLAGHEELQLQLGKGGVLVLSIEDPAAPGTGVLEALYAQKVLRLVQGR